MNVWYSNNRNCLIINTKIINPVFFILSTAKYFETFPKQTIFGTISESFVLKL